MGPPGPRFGHRRGLIGLAPVSVLALLSTFPSCASREHRPQVSGTPPAPSCEDGNGSCEAWAAAGECERNSAYMYTNCARSCNSCVVALPHRPTAEPVPPLTPSWKDEIPDRALVQRLGELSKAVYDATGVTDTARMPANTQPFLFRETSAGAEVLVGTFHLPEMHGGDAPLHIFVALRGSDENSDVMTNLNFALDKFGPPLTEGSLCADCRVHRGFNEASFADNLPSDIEEAVDLLLRDVYGKFEDREGAPTIYFTGHSLGGAQAHILSAYLAFQRPDLSVRMVNFGAPQVGDEAFKNFSEILENLSMFRFVYGDDVVARLPGLGSFEHSGHLMQMEREGITAYWNTVGDEIGDFAGIPKQWIRGNDYGDHDMWRYLIYLEEVGIDPHMVYPTDFLRESEVIAKDSDSSEEHCCFLGIFCFSC